VLIAWLASVVFGRPRRPPGLPGEAAEAAAERFGARPPDPPPGGAVTGPPAVRRPEKGQ
jgi:hypothetical protein